MSTGSPRFGSCDWRPDLCISTGSCPFRASRTTYGSGSRSRRSRGAGTPTSTWPSRRARRLGHRKGEEVVGCITRRERGRVPDLESGFRRKNPGEVWNHSSRTRDEGRRPTRLPTRVRTNPFPPAVRPARQCPTRPARPWSVELRAQTDQGFSHVPCPAPVLHPTSPLGRPFPYGLRRRGPEDEGCPVPETNQGSTFTPEPPE